MGLYYGTVPTAIAEAMLLNKAAKVKRNRINASATQYYCGVFLTKLEAEDVKYSFSNKGLKGANIVEIKPNSAFILMEGSDGQEETEIEDNIDIIEEDEPSSSIFEAEAVNTDLIYRVRVGTYEGSMPTVTSHAILELGYLGIEKVVINNKETYYCGKVKTVEEAYELKSKFVQKGVMESKVVAFLGSKKISLQEASQIE